MSNLPALIQQITELRAAAAVAYDFYRNDECRALNLRAWELQAQVEALQAGAR